MRHCMVLFLGSGPDSLHLMAEGLARRANDKVRVVCAAMEGGTPCNVAAEIMDEVGVNLRTISEKTPVDVEVFSFDLVVTLGELDASCRPNLPGMPPHYHWDFETFDPKASDEALRQQYRRARKNLQGRLEVLFASDMLRGLSIARQNLELVLDNLAQGVMAHTMNRRIFYFNHAAERITGYDRSELTGKDCHDVFRPLRFCGGDCLFCSKGVHDQAEPQQRTAQVAFTRKDGEELQLDMTITPLADAEGAHVGALVSFTDTTELAVLKRRVRHHHQLGDLSGKDPTTLQLFEHIREVARANVPVLIQGESGTGKELIAQAIHRESRRAKGPFVPINCGALPEGILESELFGHVRGAFTGAIQDKRGRFELADGGTIFLDEVGELSPAMQVKLLRVLQERCFERVGGERRIHVDVRLLSATNQNLQRLIEQNRFRRDLYYRLCVVPLYPAPLRERPMDIPLLVDLFLEEIAQAAATPPLVPSNEALDLLLAYPWPGNVRELRNVMEYINVKCRSGQFGPEHLPDEISESLAQDGQERLPRRGPEPKLNRAQVTAALRATAGNKSKAAKLLGVGRTTLYRHLASLTPSEVL